MAVIDSEGLFNGDRFSLISDEARVMWTFFWCASNTCGRLELNYRKILGLAFHRFKQPPTEAQFWRWIEEYWQANLLFVYQAEGQTWGQWDTNQKWLPTYKLAKDAATPAPNLKDFTEWKKLYISLKKTTYTPSFFQSINNKDISKTFQNISESFEHIKQVATDKEEEKEEDKEKGNINPPTPFQGALIAVEPELKKIRPPKRTTSQIETALGSTRLAWWVEWWSIYPCHESKQAAMNAFERVVSTAELWAKVRAGAIRYRQKVQSNPEIALKFGQGWINGERWEDEGEITRSGTAAYLSKNDRAVEVLMQNLAIEGKI